MPSRYLIKWAHYTIKINERTHQAVIFACSGRSISSKINVTTAARDASMVVKSTQK